MRAYILLSVRWLAVALMISVVGLAPQIGLASFVSFTASGTISSSAEATLPSGTPWSFELIYNTAAPDRDSELTGNPDPTFGRFTNAGSPPALNYFHYQAGDYSVTLDKPTDFLDVSEIHITFMSIHALDVNIHAPDLFPQLGGGPVSFHADFNAFATAPVFLSDALPENDLGPASFDQSTVTLIIPNGVVTGSTITSLALNVLTPGDANRDQSVDLSDFGLLKANFGSAGGWSAGDFDGNGAVDLSDFGLLKANFGAAPGAAVPEPAGWLVAAIAVLCCWPTMRRRAV
jgi:hypothetical protein